MKNMANNFEPYANVINKWNRIEWKIIIFLFRINASCRKFLFYDMSSTLHSYTMCSECNIIEKNWILSREIEKFAEDRKYRMLINNFFCNLQTFRSLSRLISIFLLHKNEWNEKEQKVIFWKSQMWYKFSISSIAPRESFQKRIFHLLLAI